MASARQKSCSACVKAKRRCDLGLPTCHRCATRGLPCVYPWAETLQANATITSGNAAPPIDAGVFSVSDLPGPLPTPESAIVHSTTHFADGPLPLFNPALSVPRPLSPAMLSVLDDIISQRRDFMSPLDLDLSAPSLASTALSPTELDFSSDEPATSGRVFQARTEYAARRLAAQAYALSGTGQTAFIHHTQADASAVLRDALAASALHQMRNNANAAIVRREISRRASLLITAVEAAIHSPLVEVDLLPPVQALLIYQCIRLFSIHDLSDQAQAERDDVTLLAWTDRLRAQMQPFSTDTGWLTWIRTESVRRTILFAEVLSGTYSFLKFGWDRAEPRVAELGFTAQATLWESQSAAEWRNNWSNRPRLEAAMSTLDTNLEGAKPDDLEELGVVIRALHSGLEDLEDWFNGDKATLQRWGLRG